MAEQDNCRPFFQKRLDTGHNTVYSGCVTDLAIGERAIKINTHQNCLAIKVFCVHLFNWLYHLFIFSFMTVIACFMAY
jgi:hypothetical protein